MCIGILKDVPNTLWDATVHLDFLVVDGIPFDVIIGPPSLEDLQACLDLGKQLVKVTAGDKTVKINLDLDVATEDVARSGTDSEDFTSDSGANTESSTPDENEFVLAMADCPPFESYIVLSWTTGGKDEGRNRDQEKKEEEYRYAFLRSKLSHLAAETQNRMIAALQKYEIDAWSLDDLTSAEVPVSFSFDLVDFTPFYSLSDGSLLDTTRSLGRNWTRC